MYNNEFSTDSAINQNDILSYSKSYYPYVNARELGYAPIAYVYGKALVTQNTEIGLTDKIVPTKFLQDGNRGKGFYQVSPHQFGGPYFYYVKSINSESIDVYKGFFKKDGKLYYAYPEDKLYSSVLTQKNYIPAGVLAKGWQKIDGKTYYFNPETFVATVGFQKIDGKQYLFNSNGVLQTGYQTLNGKTYLFNSNGVGLTGWQYNYSKKGWQYFNPLDNGAEVVNTTHRINGQIYGFNSEGIMLTGYQKIKGLDYCFSSKGMIRTKWIYNNKLGGWQYFNPKTGSAYAGLEEIDGLAYYFDWDTGIMQTGYQEINGKRYDLGSNGAAITGWQWNNNLNGYQYFDPQTNGVMAVGLQKIGDNYWYFNDQGIEQENVFKTINNKLYYLGYHGSYVNSWFSVNGNSYYAGSDGACYKDGLFVINGLAYGFNSEGQMLTGYQEINGKKYNLGSNGAAITGWQWNNDLNGEQYFNPNTDGVMAVGLQKIGDNYWYFNNQGIEQENVFKTINNKLYYLGYQGSYVNSWFNVNGNSYYAGSDGACYKDGLFVINGLAYGFNSEGQMLTGYQEINGKKYDLGSNGAAITGWQWNNDLNGEQYFNPNTDGVMAVGLQKIGDNYWYFNDQGIEQENVFKTINNKLYYLGYHGSYVNSWFNVNGNRYYAGSDGACYKDGTFMINGTNYTFNVNGELS